MARRYRKRKSSALARWIVFFCLLAMAVWVFKTASHLWATSTGRAGFCAGLIILSLVFLFKKKKKFAYAKHIKKEIAKAEFGDKRSEYVIVGDDYRRGNAKENLYRKSFLLTLLETFENRCAKCGSRDNGLDLDHFFLSKNEGGCFLMRHRGGYLVNNAIPLCQTCNRRKSDQSYRNFYSAEEILHLLRRNLIMTRFVNDAEVLDGSGKLIKSAPKRNRRSA